MTSKLSLVPLIACALALEASAQAPVVTLSETKFNREYANTTIDAVELNAGTCQKTSPAQPQPCGMGKLCVTGCADPGTPVGLTIEGRLVKTTKADPTGGWVAEINIDRLDGGRTFEAAAVSPGKVVLEESSWDSRWSFNVSGGAVYKQRPGPAGGSRWGMFVDVMPTLYPVAGAHWFRVALRYAAAQVSDEALHRLGIALDFDVAELIWMALTPAPRTAYTGANVTLTAGIGGAFFAQNSTAGGSAIVAGPVVTGAFRAMFPVARPVFIGLRVGFEGFLQGEESFPIIDAGLSAQVVF